MKFATLALVGSASALSLPHATRIVNRWDTNGSNCLDWGEFRSAVAWHLHKHGMTGTPQQWQFMHAVFNQGAGADHCMTAWELSQMHH